MNWPFKAWHSWGLGLRFRDWVFFFGPCDVMAGKHVAYPKHIDVPNTLKPREHSFLAGFLSVR